MRAVLVFIVIGLLYCLMAFSGCSLFKKATKSNSTDFRIAEKQAELNKLKLKTATKETNVITYNPNGSVYQFENIQEQMDLAKMTKLKKGERQETKNEEVIKETEPPNVWKWGGVLIAIIGCGLLYRKFISAQ